MGKNRLNQANQWYKPADRWQANPTGLRVIVLQNEKEIPMTGPSLLYFPLNNNSEPLRIRAAPLKISWFQPRCFLSPFHAISVPPSGSAGRQVGSIESTQGLWFMLTQTDPATGRERPSLCSAAGIRDLRKRPETITLIETLIEEREKVQ